MSNRGFAVFCLLVAGAVYAVRGEQKPTQQAQRSQVVKQIAIPLETPKLDLQANEKSLAVPKPQAKAGSSIAQPFLGGFTPRRMFIGGSKVNVRGVPGKNAKLVAQLQAGTELNVIAVKEGWSQIKTRDGKVTGWVSSNFLTTRKALPQSPLVTKPKTTAPVKLVPPKINRSAVVSQIIAFSIQNYTGNCPCPYNTMRNGRSCGGRSAYNRPGGQSPLCFPQDVTEEMIRQWKSR